MPRQNLELDTISPRHPGKCTCHDYRLVQIFQHKTQCRGCVGHGILIRRTRQASNKSSTIARVTGLIGRIAFYLLFSWGDHWPTGRSGILGVPFNFHENVWSHAYIKCTDEWVRSERETAIKPYKKTREPLNKPSLQGYMLIPNNQLKWAVGDIWDPRSRVPNVACFLVGYFLETSNHAWDRCSKVLASNKRNVMARKGSNFTNKKHTLWHIQGNQGSNIYHSYKYTSESTPRIETYLEKNHTMLNSNKKPHGNQGPPLKNQEKTTQLHLKLGIWVSPHKKFSVRKGKPIFGEEIS